MTDFRSPRHVVILGSGAMGCLFGGILREGGLNVSLVDIWAEHVEAINRRGLRLVGYGGDRTIPIRATTDVACLDEADIVSVHCKAADTERAISSALPLFGTGTVAISFQNGLGNEETIARVVGSERVLGGWTAQGASVEAPGVVRNYSEFPTQLGEMEGGMSERATAIAAAFSEAGLPTKASADILGGIWKKLMLNVALSAPSAFTALSLAEAMAVPELLAVARLAVNEALEVARASGVNLDGEAIHRLLDDMVGEGGTGANKSSVCVDVLNERPTEIDYINGSIVRLGRALGVATPVNQTFRAAVKGLESRYIKRRMSS